jgi:hypothetical protein
MSATDRRRRLVATLQAWRLYPAVAPEFTFALTPPSRVALASEVQTQQLQLWSQVDSYIEQTFIDPLKIDPFAEGLRRRLLRLYVELRRFDMAIETALDYLVDEQGDQAATLNDLGIAYFRKGELRQAAALRPTDEQVQANLTRAPPWRGDGARREPMPSTGMTATSGKGHWASGVYLYRLRTEARAETRKLLLLR